jgi:hypothetical protein
MLAQETTKSDRALHRCQVTSLIYGSLVRAVGPTNAEVLEFYVDTHLAVDNSERYEESMRRLLGEHGGGLIIDGLKAELAMGSGAELSHESFRSQVRAAEHALLFAKRNTAFVTATNQSL